MTAPWRRGGEASRRATAYRAVALVAALGAVTGCGIPVEDEPRVIRAESVPYDLLGPSNANAPEEPPAHVDPRPEDVFLVASVNGRFVVRPATRRIAPPVNLDTVVRNLLAGGVTPDERAEGLVNRVPGREVRQITSVADLAVIDVTEEFFRRLPRGRDGQLAIAQIVFTVTDFAPANGQQMRAVQFTVNGTKRTVPDGQGRLQQWVGREHYSDFLPSPPAGDEAAGTTASSVPVGASTTGR